MYSVNEFAERVMGKRRTDVVPFDGPAELGYECPKCKVPFLQGDSFNELLHWSEYKGFIWCETCNFDYPSCLCVPLDGTKKKEWEHRGFEDATTVFLRCVQDAVLRANDRGAEETSARGSQEGTP